MDLTNYDVNTESRSSVEPGRHVLNWVGEDEDLIEGKNGWRGCKMYFEVDGHGIKISHTFCVAYNNPEIVDRGIKSLLLLAQAAVSVVGWGQIARAKDAGGSYDVDLAFDVVGYSMPLTMALQTASCLGVLPSLTVMPLICVACGGVGWFLLRRRPGSGDALAKVA